MRKKTVFILQDTKESVDKISKCFADSEDYEVTGTATDGINGVSLIADKKPDILITELVLSGYDGLSVIERIKELKANVKIIVLSALCREEAVMKAISAGADYFIAKPFSEKALMSRVKELFREGKDLIKPFVSAAPLHSVSLEEKISKIFINVGIPPHIKGYVFLREGVMMAVQDPEIINNITKKLYPMIGEKFSTSASKVERAIRHAIEVAWNRGRIENINNLLGVRAYVGAEKPTNGEFIALVADKMLLEKA